MKAEENTISIFPYNNSIRVELLFPNKEKKADYFKRESQYCMKQYDDWLTSTGKTNRAEKYKTLLDKRVEFAKSFGFSPLPGNKLKWVLVNYTKGNNVA